METSLVVTGFGLTTGLGIGLDANWKALCAGDSGLGPVESLDLSAYPVQHGGEAPPLEDLPADRRDRAHAYLRGVCEEALQHAGLTDLRVPAPERSCLVIGSSLAAQASAPDFWTSFLEHGAAGADYSALKSYDVEPRLADLCAAFDVRGEALLVSNACAAGATSVAVAADILRLGRADFALACGYDALDLHTHAGFGSIKALSPDGVRPFSADRAGMQLGDGFAALILEREASALQAGRKPLARLLGYGESADAHHLTQPHPEGEGAALAMQRALTMAGRGLSETIDCISAHGTATPSNDLAEYRAMKRVFGDRLKDIPLVASKPAIGHTLGGSGAVEAVFSLLALSHQVIPPTLGVGQPDAGIGPLTFAREARPAALKRVMSNAFGFGGCNTSLIFEVTRG